MRQITQKAKKAHHRLVSLPAVMIVILIIATGYLSARTLRQNSLNMSRLRQEAYDADVIGDKAKIAEKLGKLQHYVARHMHTDTKIELRSSYQRDSQTAQQNAAASLGNVELYNRALAECSSGDVRGTALAECINEKLRGESGNLVKLPDPRLYRYSYDSPLFSFDLAGLSLVALGVFIYAGLHQSVVAMIRWLQYRKVRA